MTTGTASLKERFQDAMTFEESLDAAQKNRDLWHGVAARVSLSDEQKALVEQVSRPRKLLALSEDWCGDAVNILPWVAEIEKHSDLVELRILERDKNPDIMDSHLTHGGRSIPVVIVLDENYQETGWWGPRPKELQSWVRDNLDMDSDDRYKVVRRFYAKDKGQAIVKELVELMTEDGTP